jgi:hypothetical protein
MLRQHAACLVTSKVVLASEQLSGFSVQSPLYTVHQLCDHRKVCKMHHTIMADD